MSLNLYEIKKICDSDRVELQQKLREWELIVEEKDYVCPQCGQTKMKLAADISRFVDAIKTIDI